MAIQANRRKRKHDAAIIDGEQDDGEAAVPKKLAKESQTPKKEKPSVVALEITDNVEQANELIPAKKKKKNKDKDKETEEAEQQEPPADKEKEPTTSSDVATPKNEKRKRRHQQETNNEAAETEGANDEDEAVEKPQRFSNDFKMMHFRTKLRGNQFITELRHFLHMCQIKPKIVAKYIEKRGKPLELAEAFGRIDRTNALHVGYLCEALQLVVMEIISNQRGHMESAIHGCRYFLKTHGSMLDLLFESRLPQHRRSALKLLTAIVCVEPQLGRQVLSSYDILGNAKTVEELLSHSKSDASATDGDTVRKAFIHFVLAFLVDGNALLIRNILDRGQLIGVLAKGLVYDDHVTVCVVLNALRQYILESTEISKTKKILVFDLECCKHLRRLYDWQGPAGLSRHFDNKQHTSTVNVNPKEREAVASATHELLVPLLTSRKYGITFDAMAHYPHKRNTLQGKLLGSLYQPYADERKVDLSVKTITACPDLARHTVRNFSGLFSPSVTPVTALPKVSKFLSKIIEAVPPSALGSAFDRMTLTDFSYWIKEVCLPIEPLMFITSRQHLRSDNYSIRIEINRLLLAMMKQYSNYVAAIGRREQSKRTDGQSHTLRKFKFEMLNHFLVNFPTIETILYSLFLSIREQKNSKVDVLGHLSVTLDLVLLLCKENRSFVNQTSQILDYLDVLRPLFETNFDEAKNALEDGISDGKIQLELKSIKTILLLFPRALQPEEALFEKVLRSFVKAFVVGDVAVRTEAAELLQMLFHNTRLFDVSNYEIDLWLEALREFDAATVDNVTSILLTVFQLDLTKVNLPQVDVEETATNVENLRKLLAQIKEGKTVQGHVEFLTLSNLLPLILDGVEMAPPYDAYLELVAVLLFHYHTRPAQVRQLCAASLGKYENYMDSWLPGGGAPQTLPRALAKQWPLLGKLQKALMLQGPKLFEEIFAPISDGDNFELSLKDGQRLQLHSSLENPRRNMIYVHQLLFIVVQLVERQEFTAQHVDTAVDCLIRLLQIAQQVDADVAGTTEAGGSGGGGGAIDGNEKSSETHTQRFLHYTYAIRLSQLRTTQLLSQQNSTQLNYVRFLRRLTDYCRHQLPPPVAAKFDTLTNNYRMQLVKALDIALADGTNTIENDEQLLECVHLVDSFGLNDEQCVQMLDLLTQRLQASDYFVDGKGRPFYELLVALLRRLAELQRPVDLCRETMTRIRSYYVEFSVGSVSVGGEQPLEQLEITMENFLRWHHHHIADCDDSFFASFFNGSGARKVSKAGIRLACLVLERNGKLAQSFATLLAEHLEQKELVYPLLDVAFAANYEIDASILQRCYQAYRSGFLKSIEKPQKAALIYREHPEASAALIAKCMPKSECIDYAHKQLKLDTVELYQMRVLGEIYAQAFVSAKDDAQQATIFVNYIALNVQMVAVDLKKQHMDVAKVEQIAYDCYSWWQRLPANSKIAAPQWEKLLSTPQWLNFCKGCLKLGMHIEQQTSVAESTEEDPIHGLVMKLLGFLCDRLYPDASEDATAGQLYELIWTHSCCLDHLLGHNAPPTRVKTALLQLLETLARKAPQALHSGHIPVILGAYQARLTPADRYALALLEHYERWDATTLAAYRPFVWGESAVAFYALRAADDDERAKLRQQETSIAQVLALVVRQTCDYTIDNFPIWRSLHAAEQLPPLEFDNPQTRSLRFGENLLERLVQQGKRDFAQEMRRLCPKREELFEQCYDPAFFVPLMMHCFAPGAAVRALWPVQSGLLALSFCAMSSLDKDMRLAAACCQQRYCAHLHLAKFMERPVWLQAYDNIQSGLSELRESWLAQRRSHGGTPRVSLIPTLFIARTFNLSTEPTHLLYKRLMLFLRLKESFNFQSIPEFNVLFYSSEVEHHQYREFIVDLIRNGIKCSADLFMLVSTNTFKVLLTFYGSTIPTLDTKLLILSVLSTCVKIPGAAKIMLDHVGIISWLHGTIVTTEFHHFDILEGLISIISNLWYSIVASASELPEQAAIQLRLYRLVVLLLPLLSTRISVAALARLLNVMNHTCSGSGQHLALPANRLDTLIDCVGSHWPQQLHPVRYIRHFGGAGASSRAQFASWLVNEQNLDSQGVLALISLRDYVSEWWTANNSIKPKSVTAVVDEKTDEGKVENDDEISIAS